MASFSFARSSQPTPAPVSQHELAISSSVITADLLSEQSNNGMFSLGPARSTNAPAPNDPLQPLRAMADRVGKEVEKFAERVDHWHTHGNETARAKYQTTVKLVGKFKDVAEAQVKDLKRANDAENKMELDRSVRRRIQDMAGAPDANSQTGLDQSFLGIAPSTESSRDVKLRDLRQWQAELATWELVGIMIDQHYPEPGTDPAADKKERLAKAGGNKRYSPNNEIWERFILDDDQAKEKALVLRWLEQTARNDRSDIESITAQLETESGRGAHTWTNGWLDTKGKIKQAKRLEGVDKPFKANGIIIKSADRTQTLVTQLDPDSPARQGRALEKSDEYYERALWMVCYEMLRRGLPWSEVCDWAQERNEAWRGVSVGAAYEAHPEGGPNVAGPTVGYLFRRMCFYASRGARIPYEGAVYGLLSGDLTRVQAVCSSWDDHLHAHYNALLLSRFDRYLQTHYPNRVNQNLSQKFIFQDAVANIGDWERASQTVVGLLKQHKATADESTQPFKLIQGALIADSLEGLMFKVGTGIADMLIADDRPVNLLLHPECKTKDPGPKPAGEDRKYPAEQCYQNLAQDPHALRILVHVFILFKNGLGSLESPEMHTWMAMDNVIAAYIEMLRMTKRFSVIPTYAAQLSPERAAHCLARVVPDIRNTGEQRNAVNMFQQYRIDVVEVVAQSFTFAFDRSGLTYFTEDGRTEITSPIERFTILEPSGTHDGGLWPGLRIKRAFDGSIIEPKEEAVIEALQWYHYINSDYKQTFEHLKNALTILLRKYVRLHICNVANSRSSQWAPWSCGKDCQRSQRRVSFVVKDGSPMWLSFRRHAARSRRAR
jgi:nuclear pore complex protein Nup107